MLRSRHNQMCNVLAVFIEKSWLSDFENMTLKIQDQGHQGSRIEVIYISSWTSADKNKSNFKRPNTLCCLDQYTCTGWVCETVETVKQSGYISTCREWGPWNSQGSETVLVLMALLWLCGYIFQVVVKYGNFYFKVKFDLGGQGHPHHHHKKGGLNRGTFCILQQWSKFGDPSLNRWWVKVQTSTKWGKLGILS